MNEAQMPRAVIKKRKGFDFIWIFPLVAAAVVGYVVYDYFWGGGTNITIEFSKLHDIKAHSPLMYRGVSVGEVTDVELGKDLKHVFVHARLNKSAAKAVARKHSLFWVVEPRIGISGITGLSAIVKGNYIQVRPGAGPRRTKFHGSPEAPLYSEPGSLRVELLSNTAVGLKSGDAVNYKGLVVGAVTHVNLANDGVLMRVKVYIDHAYRGLITPDTTWWTQSGIHAHLGLFNSNIDIGSLRTLLGGGIEFESPQYEWKKNQNFIEGKDAELTKLRVGQDSIFRLWPKNPND